MTEKQILGISDAAFAPSILVTTSLKRLSNGKASTDSTNRARPGADQSANRQDMGLTTADASKNLLKLSPLFDWTRDKVTDFNRSRRGAPCTRAILPGEPERAGRW
jgi:hypothetical protein